MTDLLKGLKGLIYVLWIKLSLFNDKICYPYLCRQFQIWKKKSCCIFFAFWFFFFKSLFHERCFDFFSSNFYSFHLSNLNFSLNWDWIKVFKLSTDWVQSNYRFKLVLVYRKNIDDFLKCEIIFKIVDFSKLLIDAET